MKLDPLTSAYMKVINENASSGSVDATKSQVGKTFGDSGNDKNAKTFIKKSGPEACESEVESPEEAPAELSSETSESEPKEVKKGEKLSLKGEAKNPFDAFFNKIISEDSFDFSTDDNSLTPESDFGGPEGIGSVGEIDDESEEEVEGEESEEDEEVEDLGTLISQLKDLVGKLEGHLGHEEDESEEDESSFPEDSEFEDESEEDDEDLSEEAVEAEVLGHPLVDQEKLEAGQTKKSVYTVKGAVPVSKKKAEVVKGKKVTGKPEDFKNEAGISKLQSKGNIDTHGVKKDKFLFDQD